MDEFEKNITNIVGTKHCIAGGSGTDAIRLSLLALGIKQGDEMIAIHFPYSSRAMVTAGAKPVFEDVENDFNMNTENYFCYN